MQAPTNLCCTLRSHARPSPLVNSRPSRGRVKCYMESDVWYDEWGRLVDSHLPLALYRLWRETAMNGRTCLDCRFDIELFLMRNADHYKSRRCASTVIVHRRTEFIPLTCK